MSTLISTTSFDYPIPVEYFPGYKIIKMPTCNVSYEYNHSTKIATIKDILFCPDTLKKLDGRLRKLINELELAAQHNAETTYEREEAVCNFPLNDAFEELKRSINW